MSNLTKNYKLLKPLGSDNYNVEHQNQNMDIIDEKVKELSDACANSVKADGSLQEGLNAEMVGGISKDRIIYGDQEDGTVYWENGIDNIKKSGFYGIYKNLSNIPFMSPCICLHEALGDSNARQTITYIGEKDLCIMTRRKIDNTWEEWKSLDDPKSLDGHPASYFLPASAYNSRDILNKLKTVDGSGSGLDSDLLDGRDGKHYRGLNIGSISVDPNTTTDEYILTNHSNCPNSNYWHIRTQFYSTISSSSNRSQIAIQYSSGISAYVRNCYSGKWQPWTRIDNNPRALLTALKTVDGSGSGLDADKVDGHDSSYFLNVNQRSSATASTSTTSVATSAAVKATMDKAIEAYNLATKGGGGVLDYQDSRLEYISTGSSIYFDNRNKQLLDGVWWYPVNVLGAGILEYIAMDIDSYYNAEFQILVDNKVKYHINCQQNYQFAYGSMVQISEDDNHSGISAPHFSRSGNYIGLFHLYGKDRIGYFDNIHEATNVTRQITHMSTSKKYTRTIGSSSQKTLLIPSSIPIKFNSSLKVRFKTTDKTKNLQSDGMGIYLKYAMK